MVQLYGTGVPGAVMWRFGFPTAPVVLGMILGPLAEAQLRNTMSIKLPVVVLALPRMA